MGTDSMPGTLPPSLSFFPLPPCIIDEIPEAAAVLYGQEVSLKLEEP
jgi:hypothetical protein